MTKYLVCMKPIWQNSPNSIHRYTLHLDKKKLQKIMKLCFSLKENSFIFTIVALKF